MAVPQKNGGLHAASETAWAELLQAAAAAAEAADEAARKAHEIRDQLIVAACEDHCRQEDVAHWADVSQSRVCRILAEH